MALISQNPSVAASLPITEANVTNLTTDLSTLTTAVAARTLLTTLNVASVNLSAVDLLALAVTSKQLLPALTGRNYYVVHGLVLHYRFVTTPYNENEQFAVTVGFGTTVAAVVGAGFAFLPLAFSAGTGDLFKKTVDTYVSVPVTTTGSASGAYIFPATVLEGAALSIAIDPSFVTPLTGGDSTLTVRTFFSIVDGA